MFYPGVTNSKQLNFFTDSGWFYIFMATFHSFWDTAGRYLSGKINVVPKKWYVMVCFARLIFVAIYVA